MQGGSPALLFSFADTCMCGVGSHQPFQPPSCLQLIRTARPSSFRKGHRPVFGAAPTTAAGGVGLSPAWIVHPCLSPRLSPRQGCTGQPENKREKKGSSASLRRGPSPPFSVPAGTALSRAEGLGQHFQAQGGRKGHAEPSAFGRGLGVPGTSLISAQSPRLSFWRGSASTGGSAGLCPAAGSTLGRVRGTFCPRRCPVQLCAR